MSHRPFSNLIFIYFEKSRIFLKGHSSLYVTFSLTSKSDPSTGRKWLVAREIFISFFHRKDSGNTNSETGQDKNGLWSFCNVLVVVRRTCFEVGKEGPHSMYLY